MSFNNEHDSIVTFEHVSLCQCMRWAKASKHRNFSIIINCNFLSYSHIYTHANQTSGNDFYGCGNHNFILSIIHLMCTAVSIAKIIEHVLITAFAPQHNCAFYCWQLLTVLLVNVNNIITIDFTCLRVREMWREIERERETDATVECVCFCVHSVCRAWNA